MGKLNRKWARKLLGTKNFVVLTDTEAVINLRGLDPESLDDIVVLSAQTAELLSFYDRLGKLMKQHNKVVERFLAKERISKPTRNIKVKEIK